MKSHIIVFLSALLCLSFCGCSFSSDKSKEEANQAEIEEIKLVYFEDTLDEIYESSKIFGIKKATDEDMEEIFGFDLDDILDYSVRFSEKGYGVADIFIIRPTAKGEENVFDCLRQIKENKIAEAENYDIYGSLELAKNAEIYSRGDYIIMLMIADEANIKSQINSLIDRS